MAAKSSSSKTEEISRETDFNRSALIGWTSIEEVQYTVAPYVSKVIEKSRSYYGGYKSASEVLEEYITFKALHKTLMEGKYKLYIDQYIYHYALYIKAEMLCAFQYLLGCELQDHQREWIEDQLWRIKYKSDKHRSDSLWCLIEGWERPIDQLGQDARREIRTQTVEKCMRFKKHCHEWDTRAEKVDKKMREFEELESEIDGMRNDLLLRISRRSFNYDRICYDVEDGFHELEKVFFQLLGDGEMDLEKKWSDLKVGVEELLAWRTWSANCKGY